MTARPVVARELADRDIDEAIACYLSENAEVAALGFIDAVQQAYAHMLAIRRPDRRATPTN